MMAMVRADVYHYKREIKAIMKQYRQSHPSKTGPLVVKVDYTTHPAQRSVSLEREYSSKEKEGIVNWSNSVKKATLTSGRFVVYAIISTGDTSNTATMLVPIRFVEVFHYD